MDRVERMGIWALVLVVGALLVSFVPALPLELGDDHYGRILGRFLLHADNVLERGWAGSSYGAAWEPYASAPYAHHPPLGVFVHTAVAWLAGGTSSLAGRLVGTVAAAVSVGALAAFLRVLTGSIWPALAAVAGLAVSGYFWTFGRLGLGFALPMAFLVTRELARRRRSSGWTVALAGLGLLAGLASWEGAMVVGLLALFDLRRDRGRALASGLGVVAGLLLSLAWIEAAAGLDSLFMHLEGRAQSVDYTLVQWLDRQLQFYLRFESWPIMAFAAVGVIAGLRNARLRPVIASLGTTALAFAVVFHQNAWVHEYWLWKSSFLLAFGAAALALAAAQVSGWDPRLLAVLAVAVAVVPVARLGGELHESQFVASSAAGALAARTAYVDQAVAWTDGRISGPRWLAWHSGLRPVAISSERVPGASELVLVKRRPDDGLDGPPLDAEGRYEVRAGATWARP